MKAHSLFSLATKTAMVLLLAASTGCIAQAGTGDDRLVVDRGGLSADRGTDRGSRCHDRRRKFVRSSAQKKISRDPMADGFEKGIELKGPGVNPGDPGDPVQDPGDGVEPDPHPWRSDCATRREALNLM